MGDMLSQDEIDKMLNVLDQAEVDTLVTSLTPQKETGFEGTTVLEELVERKHDKIDNDAEREKAGVVYIADLVEGNWEKMNSVLNPDRAVSYQKLHYFLYERVSKIIESIEDDYLGRSGLRHPSLFPLGEEPKEPSVQLGWMEFCPDQKHIESLEREIEDAKKRKKEIEERQDPEIPDIETEPIAHDLKITELGRQVVDGYRRAKGYVSLDEQRRLNSERRNKR